MTVTYVRFHGIKESQLKRYMQVSNKRKTPRWKKKYIQLHSNKRAFIRSQIVESVHCNVTWSKCYKNTLTNIHDYHPNSSTVQGLEEPKVHILYPKYTEAMLKKQPANTTGSRCQHPIPCQTVTPGMSARTRLLTSIFYLLDNSFSQSPSQSSSHSKLAFQLWVTKAQRVQTSQKGSVSPGANEEIPGRASVKSFLRIEAVRSGTTCLHYYTNLLYNHDKFNYSSHWTACYKIFMESFHISLCYPDLFHM